jgi:hypothetical protein
MLLKALPVNRIVILGVFVFGLVLWFLARPTVALTNPSFAPIGIQTAEWHDFYGTSAPTYAEATELILCLGYVGAPPKSNLTRRSLWWFRYHAGFG